MKTLLAGAQILKLEKIVQMSGAITLFVGSVQTVVNCPSCQTVTSKVHSRYERAAADLPWEGIPVRLKLRVRKFFCHNSECNQRIFCEQLPEVVDRYAHRTDRLGAPASRAICASEVDRAASAALPPCCNASNPILAEIAS
jgi:transposase